MMKRYYLILLLALVTLTTWAQSTAYVSTYAELSAAVSNASVSNIVVTANIDVPCGTSGNAGNTDLTGASTAQLIINRTLTLQSQAGSKYIIKRTSASGSASYTLKSIFALRGNGLGNSGTANLTQNTVQVSFTNIIIDGGANWGASDVNERRNSPEDAYGNAGRSMIDVYLGGVLNLEDGVELRNGYTTKSDNSLLNDASTSQCFGGAVRVDYHNETGGGTVNIKAGAIIHDCSTYGGYGGALGAYNYARLNLYGGSIYNCSSVHGGAIACTYRGADGYGSNSAGTIRMYGGTISNCYAKYGGAISMDGQVENYLLGGIITSCSAGYQGGAVWMNDASPTLHIVDSGSGWLTISSCSPYVEGSASTGNYPCIYMNSGSGISSTPVYQVTFINNNSEFAVLHVLQGNSLGEAFPAAPVNAGLRFLGWYNGETQVTSSTAINDNITVTAKWDFLGNGSSTDPYLIPSTDVWNFLADQVNSGNSYSGKFFRQTADISVTTIVGTASGMPHQNSFSGNPFQGTFDGNGHILTINVNNQPRFAAPFKYVNGATIKNLKTAGSIDGTGNADGKLLAGIVGISYGNTTITNCVSSVTLTTDKGDDAALAGIVASTGGGSLTISGCVYNGSMTGASNTRCAGIAGYEYIATTTTISNTLFAPSTLTVSTVDDTYTKTFSRDADATISNCYYTTALGAAQGTAATPAANKPSNIGTQTAVYSVSGITAYTNGLYRGGLYYCGSPEYNYSLSVTSATVLGEPKYVTTFYHGTLDYQLPAGALAYTAGKMDGKVVFYRIGTNSNVIPKNTAVIIVADSSADITLTKLTSTDVTPQAGNILQGSDVEIAKPSGTVYVLGVVGSVLGFYPFTESIIPAGKAYYVEN